LNELVGLGYVKRVGNAKLGNVVQEAEVSLGEPFNEDQLEMIGHVDIVLLPVGGAYTMGPENAKKVVEQLKPKVAVPMHYYNNTNLLERFIDGLENAGVELEQTRIVPEDDVA